MLIEFTEAVETVDLFLFYKHLYFQKIIICAVLYERLNAHK